MLERRRQLIGYEVYIVEQWACSRVHPTFVITTYTGLPQHSVLVGVLSVSTNEETWSPRLRVYLKAISKFHARKKDTPLGALMVTNLSGFPSALTVIVVPGGDIKKHREDFIVNENMKRLGCSGRAGMNIYPPNGATQAKFNHLYRTSDRIPLYSAVIELVKLCQVALMLFTKLAPEYADGLLCDVTERAINDWWTEVGTEYFNVEPSDGILGPTTVAALLGMLIGARNRLNAYGAPIGKDAFDLRSTKRGVAYFQKSQKLPKTRRLDRQTLDRLHRVTSKAASGDGWTVPKAVKSTVAELSGKGGEMVMGMVGAREKVGIAEVETLDIETFIQLASGQTVKWLWFGKPRKNNDGDLFSNLTGDEGMIFSGDDNGGYIWSSKKRDSTADEARFNYSRPEHVYMHQSHASQTSFDLVDKEQALRKTMFKSVTGRMNDARSGFGRIKDAVGMTGLRGHHARGSKEGDFMIESESLRGPNHEDSTSLAEHEMCQSTTKLDSQKGPDVKISDNFSTYELKHLRTDEQTSPIEVPNISMTDHVSCSVDGGSVPSSAIPRPAPIVRNGIEAINAMRPADSLNEELQFSRSSDILKALDYPLPIRNDIRGIQNSVRELMPPCLRSTRSLSQLPKTAEDQHYQAQWPRNLSFSIIDDVVISVERKTFDASNGTLVRVNPADILNEESYQVLRTRATAERLQQLKLLEGPWVQQRVSEVEDLDAQAASDQEYLNAKYHQKLEDYNALREDTANLLAEERMSLTEALKDVDVLGAKLEYEMSALQSKVDDVEDGIAEFERQVLEIEVRAQELEDEESNGDPWFWWFIKFFNRAQES